MSNVTITTNKGSVSLPVTLVVGIEVIEALVLLAVGFLVGKAF